MATYRSLMLFSLIATFASLLSVSAQLEVLVPGGPNLWWVANQENNVAWNCQQSQFSEFTILVANSNPTVLVSPLPIIAVEQNFTCSQELDIQQIGNLPVASNYTVQLANPLNSSDIYAESQPFEIKASGSAYPASSATPQASGTTTATSSSSSSSATQTSSATGAMINAKNAVITVVLAGLGTLLAL